MRILKLRAARGWSASQVARVFAVTEETIDTWLKRVDEEGERALVQVPEPVNKFPDFVRYVVKQLKALCPSMGKVRIAQVLARAGLHLGATTVGRILKETQPVPEDVEAVLGEERGDAPHSDSAAARCNATRARTLRRLVQPAPSEPSAGRAHAVGTLRRPSACECEAKI
jgi:transcriptional regulator with XRE-family HTH domain